MPNIVLASGSTIRHTLLNNAGVPHTVNPASIDEDIVKEAVMQKDGLTAADLAEILAEAKALDVSAAIPGAYVIGCDQTLEFDGETLSKAPNMDSLRRQLLAMRGKTHTLHVGVVLARDGQTEWRTISAVHMTMRDFSPAFLGHYLAEAGEAALASVGGYQLEGPGVQLFEAIDGDYFTVLGLPLLPLLAALRDRDALPT